jgi:hypothetical protein
MSKPPYFGEELAEMKTINLSTLTYPLSLLTPTVTHRTQSSRATRGNKVAAKETQCQSLCRRP